jgi:hypothetical protein
MTNMIPIFPKRAQAILSRAIGVLVNKEHLATFLLSDIQQDRDNEWFRVSWFDQEVADGEVELYTVIFTEEIVYIDNENFIMYDEDGDKYTITPLFPAPLIHK